MFNKVVLLGNLTREIEIRFLQSGTAVGKSSIAVNHKFSVNGEKREEVCFIDITFWGRTAEIAHQYLRKGSKVLVEGRLKFDQWTDQNGQNRSKHSIEVESLEMLDSRVTGENMQGDVSYNNQISHSRPNYTQNNNMQRPHENRAEPRYQDSKYQETRYEEKIPEINIDDDQNDEIPF